MPHGSDRERWRPGDVVDVETEDGIERGAIVLGPAQGEGHNLANFRRVRFADGVVDDWDVEDFSLVHGATEASELEVQLEEQDLSEEVVLVVGGGVVGLSCALAIAKRGLKCTLLDDAGTATKRASRADTRRLHFGYDGVYQDLVQKSAVEWKGLQGRDPEKRKLLHPCATLTFGSEAVINGIVDTHAQNGRRGANGTHQLEVLTAEAVSKRWPHLRPSEEAREEDRAQTVKGLPRSARAVFDGDGFEIDATLALERLQAEAQEAGVVMHQEQEVTAIDRPHKTVGTAAGQTFRYTQLVLACGAWTNKLLAIAKLPRLPIFVSNEQVMYLRTPAADRAAYSTKQRKYSYQDGEKKWPCPLVGTFIALPSAISAHEEPPAGEEDAARQSPLAYCSMVPLVELASKHSLPFDTTDCVKVSAHQQGELLETDDFVLKPGASTESFVPTAYARRGVVDVQDQTCDLFQQDACMQFLKQHCPRLVDPHTMHLEATFRGVYASTTDNNFVCGDHPHDSSVIVATGFHGEGFQFAPSIAQHVATFAANAPVDPILNGHFTPHRFFLGQKLLAAFGGSSGSLPRQRAADVLRLVYGDVLEWAEIQHLCRLIKAGDGLLSYGAFQKLLPDVEALRVEAAQRHAVGPMQVAAVVATVQTTGKLAATTAKWIYGQSIQWALLSCFTVYIITGFLFPSWYVLTARKYTCDGSGCVAGAGGSGSTGLMDDDAKQWHPKAVLGDLAQTFDMNEDSIWIVFIVTNLAAVTIGVMGLLSVCVGKGMNRVLVATAVCNLLFFGVFVGGQVQVDMSSCDQHVHSTVVVLAAGTLLVAVCSVLTLELLNARWADPLHGGSTVDLDRLDLPHHRQALLRWKDAVQEVLDGVGSPEEEEVNELTDLDAMARHKSVESGNKQKRAWREEGDADDDPSGMLVEWREAGDNKIGSAWGSLRSLLPSRSHTPAAHANEVRNPMLEDSSRGSEEDGGDGGGHFAPDFRELTHDPQASPMRGGGGQPRSGMAHHMQNPMHGMMD
jgi:glycine/D-amino acid oxidase-like deaminating enzyme